MKKDQVDLANKVVFIADSKTPTGVSEVSLTDIAVEAFRNQMELAGPGAVALPQFAQAERASIGFQENVEKNAQTSGRSVLPAPRLPSPTPLG